MSSEPSTWSDPAVRAAVRDTYRGHAPNPDVGDRPALDRLRERDRHPLGVHDGITVTAALAVVEAIDALTALVDRMAAGLDRSGADR